MKKLTYQNILGVLGIILLLTGFTSCLHEKKFIYFQNTKKDTSLVITDSIQNYSPILRTDDLLAINVSSPVNPEVVKPFNIGGSTGTSEGVGYLIDANGIINFPVLGNVKLAGLTRSEATLLLTERLKTYVKEPIVNVRILNYKITILGEVAHPGVFVIHNERITLPEAIGLAGDLTLGGIRENILVIRDIDGKKIETRVDLTSRDIFTSPVYYLKQNDLVYVEPTKAKMKTTIPTRQNVSLIATAITMTLTLYNFFRNF